MIKRNIIGTANSEWLSRVDFKQKRRIVPNFCQLEKSNPDSVKCAISILDLEKDIDSFLEARMFSMLDGPSGDKEPKVDDLENDNLMFMPNHANYMFKKGF